MIHPIVYIGSGALLTFLTAWLIGRLFNELLSLRFRRAEHELLSIAVGSVLLSELIFVLCCFQLATATMFLAIFATVVCLTVCLNCFRNWPRLYLPRLDRLTLIFGLIYLSYSSYYLVVSLMPEVSPDGSTYHLGNVARWNSDHGFVKFTGSIYSNLSQGCELLFLFAFSIGRHSAASVLTCLYLLSLPLLFVCFGSRFNFHWQYSSAGILLFVSPVVGAAGTSAYNDVLLGFTLFSAFYVLTLWEQQRTTNLLIVAGLLSGFAYGIKYTGGLFIIYAIVFVLIKSCPFSRSALVGVVVLVLCVSIQVVPWVAKNYVWLGNPFSPFFNSVFPNPHVTVGFEENYRENMALYPEITSRAALPIYWAYKGTYVGGIFGLWILFLPLSLLSIRSIHALRLVMAGLLMGLTGLTNCGTRLIMPAVMFLAPALTQFVGRRLSLVLVLVSAVLSWPSVVRYYSNGWQMTPLDLSVVLRQVPEEEYLTRALHGYKLAVSTEKLVGRDEDVFMLDGIPQAYTRRRLWNYYESAKGQIAHRTIWTAFKHDMYPTSVAELRFAKRDVRAVRLVQMGSGQAYWFVSEVRLFNGGEELRRSPNWNLTASVRPWEIQRAFDNNDATDWSTWQPMKPGMFIEIMFDGVRSVNKISLHSIEGQWDSSLRVETLASDGIWSQCPVEMSMSKRVINGSLRPLATHAIRQLGFRFIVASNVDGPGKDLFRNASFWNMELIDSDSDLGLYKLQ